MQFGSAQLGGLVDLSDQCPGFPDGFEDPREDIIRRADGGQDIGPGKRSAPCQGGCGIQALKLAAVFEDMGPIVPMDRTDVYCAISIKYW